MRFSDHYCDAFVYLGGPGGGDRRVIDTEGQILQAPGTGSPKLLHQVVQREELKVFNADQSQRLKSLRSLVTDP